MRRHIDDLNLRVLEHLAVGVVRRRDSAVQNGLCPLNDQFSAHLHAAVFPYQLLPNGVLDLTDTMQRIFNGSPPKSVMHLVHDTRSGNGLGESALYSGACWFAPINENIVRKGKSDFVPFLTKEFVVTP